MDRPYEVVLRASPRQGQRTAKPWSVRDDGGGRRYAPVVADRILVVEDDPTIARHLERALAAQGHEVTVAGTGRDARIQSTEWKPDLVLFDLGLPDVDGVEVCRDLAPSLPRPLDWVRATRGTRSPQRRPPSSTTRPRPSTGPPDASATRSTASGASPRTPPPAPHAPDPPAPRPRVDRRGGHRLRRSRPRRSDRRGPTSRRPARGHHRGAPGPGPRRPGRAAPHPTSAPRSTTSTPSGAERFAVLDRRLDVQAQPGVADAPISPSLSTTLSTCSSPTRTTTAPGASPSPPPPPPAAGSTSTSATKAPARGPRCRLRPPRTRRRRPRDRPRPRPQPDRGRGRPPRHRPRQAGARDQDHHPTSELTTPAHADDRNLSRV